MKHHKKAFHLLMAEEGLVDSTVEHKDVDVEKIMPQFNVCSSTLE